MDTQTQVSPELQKLMDNVNGLNLDSKAADTVASVAKSVGERQQAQAQAPVEGQSAEGATVAPVKPASVIDAVNQARNAKAAEDAKIAQERGVAPAEAPVAPNPTADPNNVYTQDNMPTPSSDAFKIDSPLVGGVQQIGGTAQENYDFKTQEELGAFLKSSYEVDDLPGLYKKASTMKQELLEAKGYKAQHDSYVNSVNELPADLQKAILASQAGNDYKGYFSTPKLDLERNVADFTSKDLINAYFSGQVTPEDFKAASLEANDEDYNDTAKRMIDNLATQATGLFKQDQQNRSTEFEKLTTANNTKQEAYSQSVQNSLPSIKEMFPDVSDAYVENIEKGLNSGAIRNAFYDDNGNLLPDAAAKFALVTNGGNLINEYKRALNEKAQTTATQQALLTGRDTPPLTKSHGGHGEQKISTGFVERVGDLMGDLNPNQGY